MDNLFKEFVNFAKGINSIGIVPILYGSLGLSKLINKDLNSQDIDILIPERFLKEDWKELKVFVEKMGYRLVDLHEHEFHKNDTKIAFASEEDLLPFANVGYHKLEIVYDIGKYKILKLEDYLKVYTRSLADSYRKSKNNGKDAIKIQIIKENLKQSSPLSDDPSKKN